MKEFGLRGGRPWRSLESATALDPVKLFQEHNVRWQFYHLVSNNKHIKLVCVRLSPIRDGYNELNQLSIAND